MTKRKKTTLVVLAVAIVSMVCIALRAVPRWYNLRKVLNSPERIAMLAVIPEPKVQFTSPGGLSSDSINIGYADFSLPSDLDASMTSQGGGELVMLTSDRLSLGLLAPAAVDTTEMLKWFSKIEEMGRFAMAESITRRLLSVEDGTAPAKAGIVDMQLFAAQTRPLPFSTIFMMSHSEFQEYLIKLIMKMLVLQPAERIVPYKSTHSLGVIYIRQGGTRGAVELTTHDRKISQTISFKIDSPTGPFPSIAFSTFLATYRFTIASCPSRERIAEMIAASGIVPRAAPDEDPAKSGPLEKKVSRNRMDLNRKRATGVLLRLQANR